MGSCVEEVSVSSASRKRSLDDTFGFRKTPSFSGETKRSFKVWLRRPRETGKRGDDTACWLKSTILGFMPPGKDAKKLPLKRQ
jgi:hypothetical protein